MKLLNLPEAAKFLRISKDKLRDLAAAGDVPGMKIGGQWRFVQERLENYIREETERQTALLKTGAITTAIKMAPRQRLQYRAAGPFRRWRFNEKFNGGL